MGRVNIDGGDIAFVRVLGPIQVVTTSGRVLDLPSASQRRLLARLAVDAPRALRADLLCDVLGVSPGALRTIVSRLRKGFGGTIVVASQGRYRLTAPVDAALFTALLSQLGAGDDRIGTLERALALWTGPAFEEFSAEAWAQPEAARLAELHASAIEDHAVTLIIARRWAEAIAELRAHVSMNPLRDRAWGLLIRALGGAGRLADALAAFREYHAYLAEWVGTEPSAEVRDIQRRIAAGWDGTEAAAGRDGIGEQSQPVRSGSPQPAGPSSWRGNGWLPLQAELVRGRPWSDEPASWSCWPQRRPRQAGQACGPSSWRARGGSARRPCWARSPARYGTRARRSWSTDVARTAPPCHWNRSARWSGIWWSTRRWTCCGPTPRAAEGTWFAWRHAWPAASKSPAPGLPRGRRRRLHAQAAEVLAKQPGAVTIRLAAQIARHYNLGGLPAEARHWAMTAGDYAARQLSPAEAARWYRTALDHGAALDVPDDEHADLLVRLGHAQQQADDPGALATLTEAAALARGCGATAIVAQAALATDRGFLRLGPAAPAQVAIVQSALEGVDADPATRARLLALLAENLVSDVAGTRRTGLAREAIALADASPDRTLLARICSSVLYALWGPDREATRLRADVAERSIAAAAAAGDLPVEFGVHAAAYTVAIQLADPAGAARSLGRLHAIADQIGAPHMTWTVGWYEAFVATMQARFADADRLGRQTVELGLAIGAADGVALFAGQAAVLATIAGHHAELPPIVAEAICAGPVQLTFYLAHAIVSMASGPREVASDLLGEAAAARFRNVPPDLMWMTSMLGYAILAIGLEDLGAAAQLFAIIEPYAGEVATNLGPVAAYAGRLASLLGRHDVADQHLNAALEIAGAFDWDYHRAAILIARAAARHRSLGRLDGPARAWLATAEGICAAHGLPGMLAMIGALRA